jgi:general secretion pathway protein A
MYEEFFGHFGLQRNPFHVSPDPRRFYSTVAHDEALLQLVFGIESRKGLMVLTGEPGTGKTTILQYLLEWLGQYKYTTSYVFHPLLPSMDLLHLILGDFGIPCNSQSKSDMVRALKEWLVVRHAAGDRPVIIVDEAQVLKSRALDELNILLDLEDRGTHLVQVVLAGQPELEQKLHERKLAQLRLRIAGHYRLRPLSLRETSGYIASRLQNAGTAAATGTESRGSQTFSPEIVAEIFRYSKGIPRVVNLICEHALLAAYADRRDAISRTDVMRVAWQFELGAAIDETGGNYRGDTFCRLIPFPKLGSAEVNSATSLIVAEPVEEKHLKSVLLAELQVVPPRVANAAILEEDVAAAKAQSVVPAVPAASPTVQGTSKLPPYFTGVAKSFAADCRAFALYSVVWLRKPVRVARGSRRGLRALLQTLHGWLRVPIGSTHIPGDARRMPSAAQKHF